jgi:TrmH family RNA methyltransferase
MLITSLQNPKVKEVIRLRDRHDRDKTNLFLIEGYRELLRASLAKREIHELFICPEYFLGSNENALIETIVGRGAKLIPCSKQVFAKISYRDRPDGLLAIAPQQHLGLNDLEKILKNKSNPFLIVAEAIEKPGNLGTILRSADAVGADALLLCDRCTDIHNPNVVRASVGTLFTVPVIEADGKSTLEWLKARKIAVLAATPAAKMSYTDTDLKVPLAIAVGTEQYGLSDLWMKECDLQVSIPMLGIADSLNVATATTVLLYEALRQRNSGRSRQ